MVRYFSVGRVLLMAGALTLLVPGCESASDPYSMLRVTARQAADARSDSSSGRRPSSPVAEDQPSTEDQLPVARVDVPERTHDFGTMNPLTTGHHEFVIRNVGDAPLELRATETTCRCTVGSVPRDPIAPGREAGVWVQWTTKTNAARFREVVTLKTNDPDQPDVQLIVAGDVLVEFGATPAGLLFGDVDPGIPAAQTVVISSQVHESFAIDQIQTSLSGLTWNLAPASKQQLFETQSRSGWALQVTLPDDLPEGYFRHWLRFQPVLAPGEPLGGGSVELSVEGRVLGRLTVMGPHLDPAGRMVDLGTLARGKTRAKTYLVKVRDPDLELTLSQTIKASPGLNVTWEPYDRQGRRPGLYRMTLAVANDAPATSYTVSEPGRIHLEFSHPRISSLDLTVLYTLIGAPAAGRLTSE